MITLDVIYCSKYFLLLKVQLENGTDVFLIVLVSGTW